MMSFEELLDFCNDVKGILNKLGSKLDRKAFRAARRWMTWFKKVQVSIVH
jgi:hypothetical protein